MNKIKEINIDNERVYIKKNNLLGWGVVNPYKKDLSQPVLIEGFKINWKNLHKIIDNINWKNIHWKNILIGGNWIKFFIMIGGIILLLLAVQEYTSIVKAASECLNQSKMPILIQPYG